ncbi:Pre-mRNA-splicing factor CWC21 [Yarrowia sp. C11]|nr:Pre-mRNA-splicing factor CWC21 [Yarrowia sp. C11]KAG5364301.1 Pre-mRNA-splicing factor CWC21 [Yarrowia sp. E02]
MSYNGIGLTTPRGSATSGHIQSNISNRAFNGNRKGEFEHQEMTDQQDKRSKTKLDRDYVAGRAADVEMLEHERKRKVEVACMELQDKLEEEGEKGGDEIEEEVNTLRRQLTLKMARELDVRTTIVSADREALRKNYHEAALTKQQEMDRMRDAFDTTKNLDDRGRDRPRGNNYRRQQNREKSPVRDPARRSRSARERSPSRRGRHPSRRYSVNEEVRTTEIISERQGSGSPCNRADSRSRSRSPDRRSRRKSYRERSRSRSRERSERRGRRSSVRERERDRSRSPLPY